MTVRLWDLKSVAHPHLQRRAPRALSPPPDEGDADRDGFAYVVGGTGLISAFH